MAINIEKIKRDFVKHRGKTAILTVLAIVMTALFAKAATEMRPRAAVAELVPTIVDAAATVTPEAAADAEQRIHQSRDLWKVLREARGGIDASAAFKFDPTYFPVDPNKPVQVVAERPEPVVQRPLVAPVAVSSEEAERSARIVGTREQARLLIVRSTVVGNGNNKPIAVINDRIMTVGDRISGFEIVSIQAREVELKKDGITLAVKMSDDSPAQ